VAATAPRAPRARAARADAEELPDFCARPACRQPFTRVTGPGRPQAFCSDMCRRTAERELRQTRARLTHFEALTDQLRADVAAFTRGSSDDVSPVSSQSAQRGAEDAVNRVAGILAFVGDSNEPLARELRHLFEAVAPVIRSDAAIAG